MWGLLLALTHCPLSSYVGRQAQCEPVVLRAFEKLETTLVVPFMRFAALCVLGILLVDLLGGTGAVLSSDDATEIIEGLLGSSVAPDG